MNGSMYRLTNVCLCVMILLAVARAQERVVDSRIMKVPICDIRAKDHGFSFAPIEIQANVAESVDGQRVAAVLVYTEGIVAAHRDVVFTLGRGPLRTPGRGTDAEWRASVKRSFLRISDLGNNAIKESTANPAGEIELDADLAIAILHRLAAVGSGLRYEGNRGAINDSRSGVCVFGVYAGNIGTMIGKFRLSSDVGDSDSDGILKLGSLLYTLVTAETGRDKEAAKMALRLELRQEVSAIRESDFEPKDP